MELQTPSKRELGSEAEALVEQFEQCVHAGDYLRARHVADELHELAPQLCVDLGVKGRAELLAVDPTVIRFGFGVIGLYGLGWLLAKFAVSA